MIGRHSVGFFAVIAAVLANSIAGVAAQEPSINEVSQMLTGGGSRIWVHTKTVTEMGASGERCTAGLLYAFIADGSKLSITECIAEKLTKSDHTWALTQASPIDVVLNVDGTKRYQLRFFDSGDTMRLRDDAGPKTIPASDMEFKLGAD